MDVAVIVNVVPSYRRGFYRRLIEKSSSKFVVFCQAYLPGFSVKPVHDHLVCETVLLRSVGSEKGLVWQWLPIRRLWREFDLYVFYGNPRVLSTVLWATLFALVGKRVVIWGQGHAAGAHPLSESLRLAWWRLFDSILVYTDREADVLKRKGFARKRVLGLNNGLDQEEIEEAAAEWTDERLAAWQIEQRISGRRLLLSVGRLTHGKQFDLVLAALPSLVRRFPDLMWCVIGEGEARSLLEARAQALGICEHVRWLGASYDERVLAPWFLSSAALVHPGPIGLALLHAFGYGLPAVIHDNADNQFPEVAAFEDGVNGLWFREGSAASLCATVGALLEDPGLRSRLSAQALHTARTQYNVDVMAGRFLQVVTEAYERPEQA